MEKGPRDRASKASTDCSEKLVHVIPEEETGGYTLWIDELNIGEYGETLSEARDALLGAVRSYVCDYLDWYVFYRNFRDKVGAVPIYPATQPRARRCGTEAAALRANAR